MPWRIAWMPLVRTGCGLRADRRRCYACTESCGDSLTCTFFGGPGRIRTCGTRFRKPLLYPLSYGAVAWRRVVAAPMGRGYPVAGEPLATPGSSQEVRPTQHPRATVPGHTSGSGNGAGDERTGTWTRRWWTSLRRGASRSGWTTVSWGWPATTSTAP